MKMVKFFFHDVMPEEHIHTSDRGVYSVETKEIHISKKGDWLTVLHEVGHYIIDLIIPKGYKHMMQVGYDKNTKIFYDIIRRNKYDTN